MEPAAHEGSDVCARVCARDTHTHTHVLPAYTAVRARVATLAGIVEDMADAQLSWQASFDACINRGHARAGGAACVGTHTLRAADASCERTAQA